MAPHALCSHSRCRVPPARLRSVRVGVCLCHHNRIHSLPPPLLGTRSDPAGPFAHDTVTQRLPNAILRRTVELNVTDLNACAKARRNIDALIETLIDGDNRLITLPDDGAPDLAVWWEQHLKPMMTACGTPWTQAPWFTSETLAYRHLLAAIGYYDQTRPLHGHDLFAREKWDGLHSSLPQLRELVEEHEVEAATALERKSNFPVLISLLHTSLWGNQADSSLWAAGAHPELSPGSLISGGGGNSSKVLVDDSAIVAAELLAGENAGGRIVLVCDNSGMELVCDLLLCRWLLQNGLASHIELVVKPCPFYVSDATCNDVNLTLSTLAADKHPVLSKLGSDLLALSVTQKLSVRQDEFWSSPLAGWEMPAERRSSLGSAKLVIVKGDLQYRKLLGNRSWEPTTPFAQIVRGGVGSGVTEHPYRTDEKAAFARGFPAPLLSLRTLKAPLVVGLESHVVSSLDKAYGINDDMSADSWINSDWRVTGTFGTIHYVRHHGPECDTKF